MADLVYPPVIVVAKTVFRGLGIKFRITGTENIPATGGAVMACSHFGYLDFTFAGLAADRRGRLVRFMAKEPVFRHRVAGPLLRGMKHIPVDRSGVGAGATSYKVAIEALRRGDIVGVFPEATISRAFELKAFKTGAVRMAAEAEVPLLPTVIWGSQRILTKGRPRDLTRGRTIAVAVGEPLSVTRADNAAEATAELKARMAKMLLELQHSHPDRPDGPDDTWWLPASMGGTAPTLEEAAALDAADRKRFRAGG
jgi:1-acyl-sn-glycerol-3-phosphate acyltransferase